MSGRDVTRWNRAGLGRFQYIDGNAVHWLELLRRELNMRFESWEVIQDALSGAEQKESEVLTALLKQYQGRRGDMLWEMVRAFCRSAHILTETMNAYANEGYLRTATQWENVRRMVEMLDYHPAPPASASTLLVLEVDDEQSGTVESGFQVKYSPPDGGAEVLFESLEDIAVDASLHALRWVNWNRSAAILNGNGVIEGDADVWLAAEDIDNLSVGQVVILDRGDGNTACVVELNDIDEKSGRIAFAAKDNQPGWAGWALADAVLHLNSKQIHKALLNGERVVRFEVAHGLAIGDVVAWNDGEWRFNRVCETDVESIHLEFSPRPLAGQVVYKAAVIERPVDGLIGIDPEKPPQRVVFLDAGSFNFLTEGVSGDYEKKTYTEPDPDEYLYALSTQISEVYVAPDIDKNLDAPAVGIVQDISNQAYEFLGGPGDISSGQWVAAQTGGEEWKALLVANVIETENRFLLVFDGCTPADVTLERIYAVFSSAINPQGFQDNTTLLADDKLSTIEVDALPSTELLATSRTLIIEQQIGDAYEHAVQATISAIEGNKISFSPALDADAGFTMGNTVIRANVVSAAHGKTQPERVLGSGDATQSNQTFTFENEGVSFIADASMSSGVRAAIELSVDGQVWQQVSTLNDSRPTDAHYVVRMTEKGFLKISFGDAEHGRRLPTGINNVRIAWRKGGGVAGNLDAGSLEKAVKPHRLLNSIRQPLASSGGSDMEAVDSLQDNAPASVLALERAVSLADFRHLAASHSSVWQASAAMLPSGVSRRRRVEVTVVPSGGGRLDADLKTTLQNYLEQYATPGCRVTVNEFERIPLVLKVDIQVRSDAFDAQMVSDEVRASLLDTLSLQNMLLGQPFYLSRIYSLVEAVGGVENANCSIVSGINVLNGAGDAIGNAAVGLSASEMILRVDASPRQLIYLDENAACYSDEGSSCILLQTGEYVL